MLHELKILPEHFMAITKGQKRFEIRENDRGFQPGDFLHLRVHEPETGYSRFDEDCVVRVNYMSSYQQQGKFVVLGISDPM